MTIETLSNGTVTAAYIAAAILFILSLSGLSNQESSRRGNWYGIIGMAIAVIATVRPRKVSMIARSSCCDWSMIPVQP